MILTGNMLEGKKSVLGPGKAKGVGKRGLIVAMGCKKPWEVRGKVSQT